MPPGPDGAWAAARIRELDPAIEIVVCTAYSDVDPRDIARHNAGEGGPDRALRRHAVDHEQRLIVAVQ